MTNTLQMARVTAMALSKQLHSDPFDQQHAAKQADRLVELLAALAQQGEQRCDTARVLEWMRTPNRKAAHFAFTEGPERQAAYWIEIAQSEPAAQPVMPKKRLEDIAFEVGARGDGGGNWVLSPIALHDLKNAILAAPAAQKGDDANT